METGTGAVPIETGETLRKSLPGGSAREGGSQTGRNRVSRQERVLRICRSRLKGPGGVQAPYVAWSYCLPLNSSHTPEGRAQCREP